ncbi:2Fe-2S iron-sulfur cluster-binding protein [Bradyrhizobium zhanjiangense]|uniref:2Fe-2S iron-sulfur cluster-binding protein n=1 Tax=Bradyrhizobium zhanjiangense TaxID=1325107 RepID=UPI001008AEA5|nr:2Fe-2S iron-sulfur cluster-binding protein [Bradyrhizobium zhanjiangense]
MKVMIYDQEGTLTVLDEPSAKTLMQAIREGGLNITAQCGGCASCGTCHVYVDEAWFARLEPVSETEDAMLELAEDRKENSRLSCQIELSAELDGLTVTLAPSAGFG